MYIGVIPIDFGLNPGRGGGWNHGAIAYKANGDQYSLKVGQSSVSASYGASYTAGDIIGCAVDIDNDTITFYKNGVSQGNTTNGVSYMSPTGAKDQTYGSIIYCNGGNNIMRANFGQDSTFQGTVSAGGNKDASGLGDFKYAVPSGYNALCSKNLPPNVSSIIRPQKHFDTITYTGTDASAARTITGLEFAPDLVWQKRRNGTNWNTWHDTVRGATKTLYTNSDTAEATNNQYGYISAFGSDGFTWSPGSTNNSDGNETNGTFVAWCWKAGGAAVTNTTGNISAQVSANDEAGFSIITYTGDGNSSGNVGTGLRSTQPLDWAIVKRRDSTSDWQVGHRASGQGSNFAYHLNLNDTSALSGSAPYHMGSQSATNGDRLYLATGGLTSSATYVAYVWQERPGYSKFGKYTGNGSADGPYVHLGFRPSWIMIRNIVNGHNWQIYDVARSTINPALVTIYANRDLDEEDNASVTPFDILSNGFKIRSTWNDTNQNNSTILYMAFAEQPGITPYDTQTNAR